MIDLPIQGQSQIPHLFWLSAGVSDAASPLFVFMKSISPQLRCYKNLAGLREILTACWPRQSLCQSGLETRTRSTLVWLPSIPHFSSGHKYLGSVP